MLTEDIPPTTLKLAPVTVACEMVTEVAPMLLRVKVCGLLDPAATLPKLSVAALAASVPEVAEPELDFAAGVLAPVKPTHPESESTVKQETIRANRPSGVRRFGVTLKWQPKLV